MRTLFDETRIGPIRLKNRLIRSATWEAMADETGRPTSRLVDVYRELAEGGVGLIITSATAITSNARRIPGMLAIPDDSSIPAFRELVRVTHRAGAPVILQLVFPGGTGTEWEPSAPAAEELHAIVQVFADAAWRAQQAGFDGVQVHAAHGYFLSSFLNARKNRRSDRFGGGVEGRERFLLEICDGILARTGRNFPVLVKINCSDFEETDDGVWDTCRSACRHLAGRGVAAIEISGGVSGKPLSSGALQYRESVFREYAAEIARTVDIPVILVGLNRTPSVMTEILNSTGIGYFSLSRPLMRQPALPRFWVAHPDAPALCTSCDACRNQQGGNVCPFRESGAEAGDVDHQGDKP